MITNISDRKDTKFLSYYNTLSVEIKFHWQIIAFFYLYRWHSYINSVSLFTLGGNNTTLPNVNHSFVEVNENITIYVPAESVEKYKAAEGWSEFKNIKVIPAK